MQKQQVKTEWHTAINTSPASLHPLCMVLVSQMYTLRCLLLVSGSETSPVQHE